ncbi:hypothetical protein EAS61_28805 [Bradyrhizobium zhanjiangense]|uniref:Uncharacterized protein n=1 Tax=Bradyrhizobium zhanjiangense TaxID=1325107 RepID=A0A4Q0QFQ2_9BRAD|nr:hypothetical protein EAS61_28805 [Bradyrhizobium zhanjiangense]
MIPEGIETQDRIESEPFSVLVADHFAGKRTFGVRQIRDGAKDLLVGDGANFCRGSPAAALSDLSRGYVAVASALLAPRFVNPRLIKQKDGTR